MTIPVTLTEYEMQMAKAAGVARYLAARERNYDPGLGPSSVKGSNGNGGDIRGAQCELACSIGLNLFWRPFIAKGEATVKGSLDAGGLIQVRSTVLVRGRLCVKPEAADDDPYVLVFQDKNRHELVGWLDARACKREPKLQYPDTDLLHYVDRKLLHSIHTLKRRLHHHLALAEVELEKAERPEDRLVSRIA